MILKKKLSAFRSAALLLVLFAVTLAAGHVQAATSEDWNDPDYVKRYYQSRNRESFASAGAKRTVSPDGFFQTGSADKYTGLVYSHSDVYAGYDILHGVDVSRHNGNVNWEKVKADGIDFVILRIGYSRLNSDMKISKTSPGPLRMTKDEKFDQNLTGVQTAGLPLGIYYFSQAVTVKEAKQEADYVLGMLDGLKLDLPLVFDSEMTEGGRLAKVNPDNAAYNKIAKAFCEKVKAAGYTPMVYSSYNGMREKYNAPELETLYDMWLARYNVCTWYDGKYAIWQYSDSGKVDGISGTVDMNFYYRPKDAGKLYEPADETKRVQGLAVQQVSSTSLSLTFQAVEGADSYNIQRAESVDGPYTAVNKIAETSYTDTGLASGTEYYYRVSANYPSGSKTKTGPVSAAAGAGTKRTAKLKIKVNQLANLREQAGVTHDSIGYLAEGTKLTVLAKTKNIDGLTWYKVKTSVGGSSVTGYVSARCADIVIGKVKNVKSSKKTAKTITVKWDAVSGAEGYEIWYSEAPNGTYKLAGTVTGQTKFRHAKLKKYTEYYYRVRALAHVDNANNYGAYSAKTVLGTKAVSVKYVSVTAQAARQYAGKKYKKLVTVPSRTKMTVYYRTKDKSGTVWYHVKVKVGGKTYKAYVNSKYVRKK